MTVVDFEDISAVQFCKTTEVLLLTDYRDLISISCLTKDVQGDMVSLNHRLHTNKLVINLKQLQYLLNAC